MYLPSGEEQEFLGGRTLLGTSNWGLGCSQKMGYIGFGVGWGAKYRTYKMWHGCGVGSVFFLFFFLFLSFFLFFSPSKSASLGITWAQFESSGHGNLIFGIPASNWVITAKHETKKKNVGIKRTG